MSTILGGLVLTPILKKLVDTILEKAEKEIRAIRGVHESIRKLSSTLKNLEQYFNEAEKVQGKKNVDVWIEKLKEAAFDAEDILDLFATRSDLFAGRNDNASNNVVSFIHSAENDVIGIWSNWKTAKAIKDVRKKLDEIYEQRDEFLLLKENFAESSSRNVLLVKREAGPAVDASSIVGREDEKNNIITDLTHQSSEKFRVVPILGIGGVGKTTLAQLIFNDAKTETYFNLRLWVSVANDFDLNRILKEMIQFDPKRRDGCLTLNLTQLQITAKEVLSEKRFLLVIDNVCTIDRDHWNSLTGIFQSGANGSRVLVTGREKDHIKLMMHDNREIEPLGKLNDADSLKLFWKRVAVDQATEKFYGIGNEIIEKCKGMPLAITSIADTLRFKESVDRWKEMVENDFTTIEKNYLDKNCEILPVLEVSFDQLPSHLKPCFLLCSLFPKGHPLVKSELIKIWMAEGYIPFEDKPEASGDAYFDDLCNRSFFHRSNVRGYDVYTMHDLFHEMAVFVSRGSCVQLKDDASLRIIKDKTCHISLQYENIEKPALKVVTSKNQKQKVRTILMPGENLRRFGNTLEDLFRSLKYVRVLDLSSNSIDELPDLFKELQLLRYLDLSKTGIRFLPNSICDLRNLLTLRLLNCWRLKELPKDLSKLISLRHLELDDAFWNMLTELPPGAGNLTNLQNLTKFWVRQEIGYGIDELGNLDSLTGKLHLLGLENVYNNNAGAANLKKKKNLNHLVLQWSRIEDRPAQAHHKNTLNDLQPHSNIENLQIINFGGIKFPAWIDNGLLSNLTTLSLNHCTFCRILSLGELSALKHIYLIDMPELQQWISIEGNKLVDNLLTLQIISCPMLKILPKKFEVLQKLEIKECGSLQNLPAAPSLTSVTLIGNARLENWNENIATKGKRTIYLDLESCPILRPIPGHVHVLERTNPNGEHLKLDGSLEDLSPHSNSLMILQLFNISELFSLKDLPRLLMLKVLYINGCNNLRHLWEGVGDLQSQTPALTYLSIKNCPNLIGLTESRLPAQLETLVIASCNGLKSLGSDVTFKYLTSLMNINIENCQSLMSLPVGSFPSSLKHLKIVNCPQLEEVVNNTVVNLAGTESLAAKLWEKYCCLM